MRRLWEFLIFLVIMAFIVQAALNFIIPLVPYMLIGGVLLVVGSYLYRRGRSW